METLKAEGFHDVTDLLKYLEKGSITWNDFMAEQPIQGIQDDFHVELDQLFVHLFYMVEKKKLHGPYLKNWASNQKPEGWSLPSNDEPGTATSIMSM